MPTTGTAGYLIYKELMQWREYPPFCTDTIALFPLYCQRLFLSFFVFLHLPFSGLVGGMPTVSRGPIPRGRYRVSHLTGFVKYFFHLFPSFFIFFWLGGVGGSVGWVARWGGWLGGVARWGGRLGGVGGSVGWAARWGGSVGWLGGVGGAFGRTARFASKSRPYICADTSRPPHPYWTGPPYLSRKVLTNFLLCCTVSTTFPNGGVQDAETYRHI